MTQSTESYLKVPYDLRPAKQVERRMLIDAFHRLAAAGFPIADYQYTGFGSIFFVDFILFHKLLGINNLLSVEWDGKIKKRVNFNAPFAGIKVKVEEPIGDIIPTLAPEIGHILWLDYDDIIRQNQMQDVVQAAGTLSSGSILLVTVDVEPPPGDSPKAWRTHFEAEATEYLGGKRANKDFALEQLPGLNAHIIEQAIKQGLVGRDPLSFQPLFNFLYRDGHEMLTVGGMFVTPAEKRRLRSAALDDTRYYRSSLSSDPYRIRVPNLTRKERMYLDQAMPCADGWLPTDFELSSEDVESYREVYRFCPAYAELLL